MCLIWLIYDSLPVYAHVHIYIVLATLTRNKDGFIQYPFFVRFFHVFASP